MTDAPYANQIEYLDDWFQILVSRRQDDDGSPSSTRTKLLEEMLGRVMAGLESGLALPFEEFVVAHELSLQERTILLLLLRDAVIPSGETVSNLPFLVQCLGVQSLSGQFEIRSLLEEESRMRSLGLIECDQDPVPIRRLYRLAPRWVDVLLGNQKEAYALPEVPKNEIQAFELLARLVASLSEATEIPSKEGKLVWSGPAMNGPGWDALASPRADFWLYLRALSRSGNDFGRIVRDAQLSPAEAACLASIVSFQHRMNAGMPVPSFVDFMHRARPGGKDPAQVLNPSSRLSSLIRLEPEGEALARQRIVFSDHVASQLVPYTVQLFAPADPYLQDSETNLTLLERRKPRLALCDVVLEPAARQQIDRALRERECVGFLASEWGFDGVATGSTGTVLLFHGAPGTGKTLTAEAVAGTLGVRFSVLRTEGITSKWVGQSEKRLLKAFQEAAGSGDILLIDEADSLLGNRDLDSRRHEITLTNLLLQEIERFSGIVVLTTNRDGALDAALQRRLTAKVEFRVPGSGERKQLWRRYLSEKVPLSSNVDLDALAHEYVLTGATIRLACLAAATIAFEREGKKAVIRQLDLEEAAASQTGKKSQDRVMGFFGVEKARHRHHELQLVQTGAVVPEKATSGHEIPVYEGRPG